MIKTKDLIIKVDGVPIASLGFEIFYGKILKIMVPGFCNGFLGAEILVGNSEKVFFKGIIDEVDTIADINDSVKTKVTANRVI